MFARSRRTVGVVSRSQMAAAVSQSRGVHMKRKRKEAKRFELMPATEDPAWVQYQEHMLEANQQWQEEMAQAREFAAEELAAYEGLELSELNPDTVRTGLIAIKAGMMPLFDEWGQRIPVTVLEVPETHVVQVKTLDRDGYVAVQLGAGHIADKKVNKAQKGMFAAQQVQPKRHLAEFRVSEDALLPVGTPLTVRHFVPGQYIDATGHTSGKGFQGVMKRHGFSGLSASHGVSVSHRSGGSTGQCQDPGRVFKNKKMAGRMGHKQRTQLNLQVMRVDTLNNCLLVKGAVPGRKGTVLRLRDAVKKDFFSTKQGLLQPVESPPPTPTFIPHADMPNLPVLDLNEASDPFEWRV